MDPPELEAIYVSFFMSTSCLGRMIAGDQTGCSCLLSRGILLVPPLPPPLNSLPADPQHPHAPWLMPLSPSPQVRQRLVLRQRRRHRGRRQGEGRDRRLRHGHHRGGLAGWVQGGSPVDVPGIPPAGAHVPREDVPWAARQPQARRGLPVDQVPHAAHAGLHGVSYNGTASAASAVVDVKYFEGFRGGSRRQ